jgi:hypothetical protein
MMVCSIGSKIIALQRAANGHSPLSQIRIMPQQRSYVLFVFTFLGKSLKTHEYVNYESKTKTTSWCQLSCHRDIIKIIIFDPIEHTIIRPYAYPSATFYQRCICSHEMNMAFKYCSSNINQNHLVINSDFNKLKQTLFNIHIISSLRFGFKTDVQNGEEN